ncbi:RNA polymerase sigma factor RpoE [soil metagenome]
MAWESKMANTTLDDTILIERYQRGDKSAMETLIARHQPRAFQYAYRLTRSSDEASDVVSEAFIRVYKAIDSFKGQSAFTTWLHRIVTNCFLDRRKKANARQAVSLDQTMTVGNSDVERQFEAEDSFNAEDEAFRSAQAERLNMAILKLPEYQRAMILMYHADMLSYEEIAETLDLPMGTVKSRLNRARFALREMLSHETELFALA